MSWEGNRQLCCQKIVQFEVKTGVQTPSRMILCLAGIVSIHTDPRELCSALQLPELLQPGVPPCHCGIVGFVYFFLTCMLRVLLGQRGR